MFCSSCGSQTADGSAFCGACGRPIVGYSVGTPAAAAAGTYPGGAVAVASVPQSGARAYAGFWLRFVAYIIDGLLLTVVLAVIVAIVIGFIGLGTLREQFEGMDRPNAPFPAFLFVGFLTFLVILILISWLYEAGMESSEYQGSLGKMALGLVVTDMEGRRISFARASGRFFAKMISELVPLRIAFIMAGFTEKKQALHDMIASCLVLRKV